MCDFRFLRSICSVVGVLSLPVGGFALGASRDYTASPNVGVDMGHTGAQSNRAFAPNPGIGPSSYTGLNGGAAYGYGGPKQTVWVGPNGGYAYRDLTTGRTFFVSPGNSEIAVGVRAPGTPTVRYAQINQGVPGLYSYNWVTGNSRYAVPGVGYGGPVVNNVQPNGWYTGFSAPAPFAAGVPQRVNYFGVNEQAVAPGAFGVGNDFYRFDPAWRGAGPAGSGGYYSNAAPSTVPMGAWNGWVPAQGAYYGFGADQAAVPMINYGRNNWGWDPYE